MKSTVIIDVYQKLLSHYGPQGWWPIRGSYRVGDYSTPRTKGELFEICVGAILTQNTSWKQVEYALSNLHKAKLLSPRKILSASRRQLADEIKPAGYYNQKVIKLNNFAREFVSFKGAPKREELLSIWGIGPETADSILLYGYHVPVMVVDAYTKRIFSKLGVVTEKSSYHEIQAMFHDSLPKDTHLLQEYHALIVQHAKHCYSKKPYGVNCFLLD